MTIRLSSLRSLLAFLVLLPACATAPPRVKYGGPSITAFADSLGYEPENHADSTLLTGTVKILPSKLSFKAAMIDQLTQPQVVAKNVADLRQSFDEWCLANGGIFGGGLARAVDFELANGEYWRRRIERNPKLHRQTAESRACLEGTPPHGMLAAYINLADADIAFYDKAAAAVFVETYLAGAKAQAAMQLAEREQKGKAEEEQRKLEDEEHRRRDPNPAAEPQRAKLAGAVSALVKQYGILNTFRYLGHCRVEAGKQLEPATAVFLGKLDRRMLGNVEWNDVPTIGIVFHPYITDGGRKGAKLSITNKDAAAQIVRLIEEIADTCKAPL